MGTAGGGGGRPAAGRGGRPAAGRRALNRFLERPIGPWFGRVWGLIVNLLANAMALWGVASVMRTGEGWIWIVIGGVATAACIAALALPAGSRDPGT